jgi:hypothetical protein
LRGDATIAGGFRILQKLAGIGVFGIHFQNDAQLSGSALAAQ